MAVDAALLNAITGRFKYYKKLGDDTFKQLEEPDFFYRPSPESNSIAIIIQHFYGNALSRFTNFLQEDGEKEWRKRDSEFEAMEGSKEDLLSFWHEGWKQVFDTLNQLKEDDLEKTIFIRNEPHLVFDALLRQLAHYPYHVGQIVYIGKMLKDKAWKSLSIPKYKSEEFNQQMRAKNHV